ncbi:MAG: hypothetical protein CMJ32_05175 [Phycisphaerae bacterium]|nr:hypothetical protein [Phycisphaerae bacterium]
MTPDYPQMIAATSTAFLLSIYKPILMLVVIIPWAWVIGSRIEPDTRRLNLNYHGWNGLLLGLGILGIIAMLAIPLFWIGWFVCILVMYLPLMFYMSRRNSIVPEEERVKLTSDSISQRMESRKTSKAARKSVITYVCHDGSHKAMPPADDPVAAIHLDSEALIEPALNSRATRLDVIASQKGVAVSQLVDSVRYKLGGMTMEQASNAIDYLKSIAGLDLEDRRRRQEGAFNLSSPSGDAVVNITTSGSSNGISMRLDFNRKAGLNLQLKDSGLLPEQRKIIEALDEPHDRHGVVLLGTASGQGMTTLGYALLRQHDAFTTNIKTLEMHVEDEVIGVDHVQFDQTNKSIDFATQVQSMLRRDPDILMIDSINEPKTGTMIAASGRQGPLIYVSVPHGSVPEVITEWFRAVGDLKDAAKPLRYVLVGRLLRKLCPNCKQAFKPSKEQARKLGINTSEVNLYRPSGKVENRNKLEECPACQGTGCLGLTSAYELMEITSPIRRMLSTGDLKGAYTEARSNKMIYLQEAALAKVTEGVTSLEEVARVFATKQSKSGSGKKDQKKATADA